MSWCVFVQAMIVWVTGHFFGSFKGAPTPVPIQVPVTQEAAIDKLKAVDRENKETRAKLDSLIQPEPTKQIKLPDTLILTPIETETTFTKPSAD